MNQRIVWAGAYHNQPCDARGGSLGSSAQERVRVEKTRIRLRRSRRSRLAFDRSPPPAAPALWRSPARAFAVWRKWARAHKLAEPLPHGGMTMHGHADVQVERHDQRGGRTRLQKVRDLGANDENLRQLDDRPRRPNRRHEAVTERHVQEYRDARAIGPASGRWRRGLEAIVVIRSCARRFDAASSVCAVGTCRSRLSYRCMSFDAMTTTPSAVRTPTYCDAKVCFPPVYTVIPGMMSRPSSSTSVMRPARLALGSIAASALRIAGSSGFPDPSTTIGGGTLRSRIFLAFRYRRW